MSASDLVLNILAVDKASATLTGVGKSMGDLESRTKRLSDAGRMLGAGAIIAFGAASIKAYAEAEKSQIKLQEAYRKFPAVADVSIQSMRELNSAIQAKTGTDDDELAAAEAKLAMYDLTGSQIRDLIPLVNDFAVAQGIGVADAAGQVGKAMMGNTRALKALGIDYKVTGDRAKDFENIMGLLEQKVGGAGDAFGQSAAGQMKILQATFSDLQEEVGAQLVPALQAFVAVAKPVLGVFGGLPQPMKAVIVAVTGLGAAALIAGPRILAMRAAMLQAGAAGAVVGKGMGIATRALMVYAVAVAASSAMTKDASLNTEGLAGALEDMAASGQAAGEAARFFGEGGALLGANLQWATGTGLSGFDKITYGLGAVESALGLTATTSNDAKAQLSNLDAYLAQLAGTSPQAAAAGLDYVRQKASELGISADEVNRLMPTTISALSGVKSAGGEAADGLGEVEEQAKDTWDVAKELTKATNDLKTSLDELGGKAISVDGATSGLQAAYDDAAEAVKTLREETDKANDAVNNNGTALDLTTEAGRTAQGALEGIATKADTLATAMDTAGASTAQIRDKMATAREEFVKNAVKMGLNEEAANRLADSYGLVPDRIATEVQIKKDAEAKAKAEELRRLYGTVPPNLYTYTYLPNAGSAISAAQAVRGAIVSIPRTWSTTIVIKDQNGNNARIPTGVATGGYIQGPGTGTSDSIPARLSNGEYVIRAASVARAGVAFLNDLNDNGMIDSVAIGAGGRAIVNGARDRAQAQSAQFWSHTVLQVDGKQLAESLVKYKRSIGNAPLGVS